MFAIYTVYVMNILIIIYAKPNHNTTLSQTFVHPSLFQLLQEDQRVFACHRYASLQSSRFFFGFFCKSVFCTFQLMLIHDAFCLLYGPKKICYFRFSLSGTVTVVVSALPSQQPTCHILFSFQGSPVTSNLDNLNSLLSRTKFIFPVLKSHSNLPMWLNVIQARLNRRQCWPAVSIDNCMWGGLRALLGPQYFYSAPLEVKSFRTHCLCLCLCQSLFVPSPSLSLSGSQ